LSTRCDVARDLGAPYVYYSYDQYSERFAAVCLHVVHYNFCRKHATLKMTPAMAAGVTDELWSMRWLLDEVGV
jgi:hypothetical protein